jgi:hypothetical protein
MDDEKIYDAVPAISLPEPCQLPFSGQPEGVVNKYRVKAYISPVVRTQGQS